MPKVHRKRCRHYDDEQSAHFLTFSCYHRIPLFSKPRSCEWLIDALRLARQQGQFDLWAFVIMPEHVHLVLQPPAGVRISQILTTLKQSVSKRAIPWLHEHAPQFLPHIHDCQPSGRSAYRFWQRGGGYDRNLRTTSDVHEKIDYVHKNPVRRGLTEIPEQWPRSSARAWHTGIDDPVPIDRHSVPRLCI